MTRLMWWIVLAIMGITLIAFVAVAGAYAFLGISGSGTSTRVTPVVATATPEIDVTDTARSGSISGRLWHDLCALAGGHGSEPVIPSDGCEQLADGSYAANGVADPGEPGLGGAFVQLGEGACPAAGLATVGTLADGSFLLDGLEAGTYCLSVDSLNQPLMTLVPGAWTSPAGQSGQSVAQYTVELEIGEEQTGFEFGWDYQFLPVAEATGTPAPPGVSCTDRITFVSDVTVPDNTVVVPGQTFVKVWRLRNSGTCAWASDYAIVFVSGQNMGSATPVALGTTVAPGSTVDVRVSLVAPSKAGTFRSNWMLRNTRPVLFGLGDKADQAFWTQIVVASSGSNSGSWYGEYFANRTLTGSPSAVRYDSKIEFDWGGDRPMASIPADDFSVRWTRTVNFEAGTYRFTARSDDGIRLWVDNVLILDAWVEQDAKEFTVDINIKKGVHTLKVGYFERSRDAEISLTWQRLDSSSFPEWKGEYFANRELGGTALIVRNDPEIDFNWGSSSPAIGLPSDNFSVRWTRIVNFETGRYRLMARADDGIRVSVNGTRVIREWHDGNGSALYSYEMDLSGPVELKVEYYENSGQAKIEFWWERVTVTATATPTATATNPATPTPTATPTTPAGNPPTATPTETGPGVPDCKPDGCFG